MKYVRCVYNKGNEASLNLNEIYQSLALTSTEAESGMIRVIDNEGEDYLYPDHWFEVVSEQKMISEASKLLSVHLTPAQKVAIRDLANARGISMSALVREWIEERLDLPEVVEYA